ncbi:MAG: hypothetical protein P4M11_09050 [Candidatus Pacebacteria bacterium]|nr:hypothetical protein [Candidatus Paceibacterota bacterium]
MGVIVTQSFDLAVSPAALDPLHKFDTKVWSFARMSAVLVPGAPTVTPENVEVAMPTLSTDVQIYSAAGAEKYALSFGPGKTTTGSSKGKKGEMGLCTALSHLADCPGLLAAAYECGEVAVWSCAEKKTVARIALSTEANSVLKIETSKTATGRHRLYAGIYGCEVFVMDFSHGSEGKLELVTTISDTRSAAKPGISDIKVRADGKLVFTAGYDFRVKCYDTKSFKFLAVLKYHTKNVNSICLIGNRVVVGANDECITEWELY